MSSSLLEVFKLPSPPLTEAGAERRPSQEERRSPRLHVAEELDLRRTPYLAELLFVRLTVLLAVKDYAVQWRAKWTFTSDMSVQGH